MNNQITATISFDYKGENLTPSSVINLDEFVARGLELHNIYSTIASENRIDHYSYEYEIFTSSEITYSDAEGIAAQFIDGGDFDFDGFRAKHHEQQLLETLQKIARQQLQIDDLEQEPAIKRALLDACRYGETLSQS